MRSVSLTTTSARANATSGSPIEWVKAMATFVPHSGWTRGLPGATASATSTTGGSASHATAIRWTASSAHARPSATTRSEEHTSELQSLTNLVCRLLLEKKK